MSFTKDDKKDVDKESSTLKKEPMLISSPTVLNKSSDIDMIPSGDDQESITLDIISENAEPGRCEETTKPNISPGEELGSPENDQIEKMAMMPRFDPNDEMPVDSISSQGKLDC